MNEEIDEFAIAWEKQWKSNPWWKRSALVTWWKLEIILGLPKLAYRRINRFIQRGRRGWGNEDTWSLYCYLSQVITGSISHLRENYHGYPADLDDETWDIILRKIEYAFNEIQNEEDNYNDKEIQLRIDEGFNLFRKYYMHLWD